MLLFHWVVHDLRALAEILYPTPPYAVPHRLLDFLYRDQLFPKSQQNKKLINRAFCHMPVLKLENVAIF